MNANLEWKAIAFTWPVKVGGMEASERIYAGCHHTREDALSAAEQKMREIGGVGFTVEPVRH